MYENLGVRAEARTESTITAARLNTNAPAARVPGSLGTMAGTVKAARALRMAGTAYFGEGMRMAMTFEQGWAARPFKEQFPELTDKAATHLDRLNRSITDLYMAGFLTDSQMKTMREKKMPKAVAAEIRSARLGLK